MGSLASHSNPVPSSKCLSRYPFERQLLEDFGFDKKGVMCGWFQKVEPEAAVHSRVVQAYRRPTLFIIIFCSSQFVIEPERRTGSLDFSASKNTTFFFTQFSNEYTLLHC
jgi:hypothetical protein